MRSMKTETTPDMLPVMGYRNILGHARTQKAAERLIRRTVGVPKAGKLHVWRRPDHIAEILDLPVAWVFSISFGK